MSIEREIRAAVLPIVPVCEPHQYDGDAEEYCTFNYGVRAAAFGDNRPVTAVYQVQLHWFLPAGNNPLDKQTQIVQALLDADASIPVLTDASDDLGQHYIFEFEMLGGLYGKV